MPVASIPDRVELAWAFTAVAFGYVATSLAHCGGCGKACGPHPNADVTCTASKCKYACKAGYGDCNGTGDGSDTDGCEAKLDTDTRCGSCSTNCTIIFAANAEGFCASATTGTCGLRCVFKSGTSDMWGDCNGDLLLPLGDGCEKNLASDIKNCGACYKDCGWASSGCSYGVCK